MANWSNPTLSSLYTDFLTEVKNRDVDLALGFDGISPTPSNLPTGAIRWDSSAGRWKKWTGSAWGELAATYALTAVSTTGDITVGGAIVFEGATANDYETTLTVVDPTADRTITLPNVTGTVVTTGDSGTVTSAMIADGTIVNGDISATAAIAGSKISPDFGAQNSITTGTSTAASFIPSSATAPTNGIYLPATNTVGISTNGTGKVYVTSGGNVGIGAANITGTNTNLEVGGNTATEIKVSSASANNANFRGIRFGVTGDSVDYSGVRFQPNSGELRVESGFAAWGGFQTYYTNGTERLRITSTGDVNIKGAGTAGSTQAVSFSGSAPINSLVVDSSGRLLVGTSASYNVGSGVGGVFQVSHTTNTITSSFTDWSSVDSGAFICLGKSKGGALNTYTSVANNDTIATFRFAGADGTSLTSQAATIACQVDGTPATGKVPGRLVFSTTADGASSPTPRMTITSTGATLIGTTGVSDGERLKVENSGAGNSAAYFVYASTDNRAIVMSYHAGSTGSTSRTHYEFRNSGGVGVGTITANGTATAYNTSSDYRLKENVVPLTGAADRLNQLQVHRFNFIADPGTTVDGFIAHEAQAIVPECVTGEKDAVDADGNPIYQGIDQSKLVPLLTAALQEAILRIESLESKVAALEAR